MVCTRGVSVPLCQGGSLIPTIPPAPFFLDLLGGMTRCLTCLRGCWLLLVVVAMTCAGTLVHCRGHQPRAILTLGPHFSPPCPSRHSIHYFIFSHMDHNFQDIFILCICAFNSRIKVSCADNLCAEVRWFAGDS